MLRGWRLSFAGERQPNCLRGRVKRWWMIPLSLAIGVQVAGCGVSIGSGPTSVPTATTSEPSLPSGQTPLSSGWLGPMPNYLTQIFIQLTQSSNHIQGTVTEVSVTSDATLSTTDYPFTATVTGSTIAFDVQGSSDPYWAGQLQSSGQMVVQFDNSNGPETATLGPSSIAAFDSAEASERAILDGNVPGTCTVNYPNHAAIVTLVGTQPDGNVAWQDCQKANSIGYWWDNNWASNSATEYDSGVCVYGSWGSWADIVRDEGGQVIGSQICQWLQQDGGPSPTFLSTPPTFYAG